MAVFVHKARKECRLEKSPLFPWVHFELPTPRSPQGGCSSSRTSVNEAGRQALLSCLPASKPLPSGRVRVDHTPILGAFLGWLSQLEALPGGSGVCNNSHCFIRSNVFNLDNCTAWQRRTAKGVGVRAGKRRVYLASSDLAHHHLVPLPSAFCRLGLLKLHEILTR